MGKINKNNRYHMEGIKKQALFSSLLYIITSKNYVASLKWRIIRHIIHPRWHGDTTAIKATAKITK